MGRIKHRKPSGGPKRQQDYIKKYPTYFATKPVNPGIDNTFQLRTHQLFKSHPQSTAKPSRGFKKSAPNSVDIKILELLHRRTAPALMEEQSLQDVYDRAGRITYDFNDRPLRLEDEFLSIELDEVVALDRLRELSAANFKGVKQEDVAVALEAAKLEDGDDKRQELKSLALRLLRRCKINDQLAKYDQAYAPASFVDPDFEHKVISWHNSAASNNHVLRSWQRTKLASLYQTQGLLQTMAAIYNLNPDSGVTVAEDLGYRDFEHLYSELAGKTVIDLGSGLNSLAKAFALKDRLSGATTNFIPVNPAYALPITWAKSGMMVTASQMGFAKDQIKGIDDEEEFFREVDKRTVTDNWIDLKSIGDDVADMLISSEAFPKHTSSNKEIRTVLGEIMRVLKPGGKVVLSPVVSMTDVKYKELGMGYDVQLFCKMAGEAGFTVESRKFRERHQKYPEGRAAVVVLQKPE